MDILQKIHAEEYYPTKAIDEIPKAMEDMQWAFFDEVEKVMGEEFIDKHWENLNEARKYRDFTNFREGFRLGVSLMLEML